MHLYVVDSGESNRITCVRLSCVENGNTICMLIRMGQIVGIAYGFFIRENGDIF